MPCLRGTRPSVHPAQPKNIRHQALVSGYLVTMATVRTHVGTIEEGADGQSQQYTYTPPGRVRQLQSPAIGMPLAGPLSLQWLQDTVGPIEAARVGPGPQPHQLADGLAHGTGVVGEALDVLEGLVDDVVGAGGAVQVAAGQPLEVGVVGDAVLAVGQLRPQGQGPSQGAAAQAVGPAGAQLCGRPDGEGRG